ncbi:MAG: alkaline phosphatase [Bacteroidota bacterium]
MKKIGLFLLMILLFLPGGATVFYFLYVGQKIKRIKSAEIAQLEANKANAIQSVQKAKNVILLIGDGMGLAQVSAGMAINGNQLQLERCTTVGLSKTSAANRYITDSASSATAMSSGKKTNNGAIAVTPDEKPTVTILEMAEEQGMSTGLIATSKITHATPAAFIAHERNRGSYEAIAADFLDTEVDVVIGGGMQNFVQREDGRNLIDELKGLGYEIFESMEALLSSDSKKLYALCAEDDMPTMTQGRGEFLGDAIMTAIDRLSQNEKGFFLMAESSQIDWGGHDNNAEYVITETLDFDKSIGQVLDFAAQDSQTLVIITADHETGGMSITEYDRELEEFGFKFSTFGHTPIMVPVYAYGPGSEAFTGIYENTEIFFKMVQALGLNTEQANLD